MKINYQNKLIELVNTFNSKPSLLLHSCCGPCSTEVISFLKEYFNITVYYYNPNIEPQTEYEKRKAEQIKFIKKYKKENPNIKLDFLDCDYSHEDYQVQVIGYENEPEGGIRCHKCYYLRLYNTALKAKNNNYSFFGTTLTVSPYKNSQVINEIGDQISKDLNIPFIYSDFKKNDGYKNSILLSQKYNLYRQNYCGCLYAKNN